MYFSTDFSLYFQSDNYKVFRLSLGILFSFFKCEF